MSKYHFIFSTGIIAVALCSAQSLKAQNTTPYWSLHGNSNATLSHKIGTTNKVSLRFITNNKERMKIHNNGNVGIGTPSPLTKLHVAGRGLFTQGIVASDKLTQIDTSELKGTAIYGVGTNNGVYGTSEENTGVTGVSFSGAGVSGISSGGYGVRGINYGGIGILGTSEFEHGVKGVSNSGTGIYGESIESGGVEGKGYSFGVSGSSEEGYGIMGGGFTGVYGFTNQRKGIGVSGYGFLGVDGSGSDIGIRGDGGAYGVIGIANSTPDDEHYEYRIGVYGIANNLEERKVKGVGVWGESQDGYGGRFSSDSSYGLLASTGNPASYAGVFEGPVLMSAHYNTSDKNLKQNIEDFKEAMSIIQRLKPRNYEFKNDTRFAALNLPQGKHFGFIAQELEEVLPNLVKESTHRLNTSAPKMPGIASANGRVLPAETQQQNVNTEKKSSETVTVKAVNYTELIPIMVKALQEQQDQIEKQQQQIDDLKQMVSGLAQGHASPSLPNSSALAQNSPNPVISSTSIPYHIPAGSNKAQVVITDNLGRLIKSIPVTTSGVVNFDASALSSGVYNYSLVVDNQTIQTRKMTVKR